MNGVDVEQTIEAFLARGKYEPAMALYEHAGGHPRLLLRFLKMAFFNRSRSEIGAFVHKHVEALEPVDRAYALSKIIALAEMDGNLTSLSKALEQLRDILNESCRSDKIAATDAYRLVLSALGAFMIRSAEAIITKAEGSEELDRLSRQLTAYLDQCRRAGFDPYVLDDATNRIAERAHSRVTAPTIVARVTARIWHSLDKATEDSPLADGLKYANFLRERGHNVELAPQYALPGPSLMAPFDTQQSQPIVFVDYHKYSTRSDLFIHCKPTHNKRMLIDRRGYSGWAEIQRRPDLHRFKSVDLDAAQTYCNARREEDFGPLREKPASFHRLGRFGVIPLQMPGDSVQLLSRFSFSQMIDASITFLHSRGLSAVLRRHPQCLDPEVTSYLKELEGRSGVYIVEESTRQLILHSNAVLLCNSSVGWDAILAHKPLICFGLAEYSRAAYQVHDLPDLEEAPALSELMPPRQADQFYYYFWDKYVVGSRKGELHKIDQLCRSSLSLAS